MTGSVRELQAFLADSGYDVGPIDGIAGKKTAAAVMEFQGDHNLAIDGIAGPKTWRKIRGFQKANEARKVMSQAGVDFVKRKEGFRSYAYRDAVGVWTIGYGHTAGVKPGDRVTMERAEEFLREDLRSAETAVSSCVDVSLNQGQFDALVSFAFNCGNGALLHSTLLKKLNAGDYNGAAKEFLRWCHAGGRRLEGLVIRRREESHAFETGSF
jgi:lysozyme